MVHKFKGVVGEVVVVVEMGGGRRGGGGGGASSQLKKVARRIFVQTCGSFSNRQQTHVLDTSSSTAATVTLSFPKNSVLILRHFWLIKIPNFSSSLN